MRIRYMILEQTSFDLFELIKKKNTNDSIQIFKIMSFGYNRFTRFVRRFCFNKLKIKRIWINHWYNKLKNVDNIIIFDSIYTVEICKIIKKKYPKIRIIVYYWNSVNESMNPTDFKNLNCELWTYDEIQASELNMKFNTTFLFDFKDDIFDSKNIYKDVFYIGKDKGRSKQLALCHSLFLENNISHDFFVYGNSTDNDWCTKLNKKISYMKMLEKMQQYRIVLDVNASFSTGMTLRPLEALYSRKKLITTNTNMINSELYFYNKNNIFVIGIDDRNRIKEFVTSEFVCPEEKVFNYYSFFSWVLRFDIKEK